MMTGRAAALAAICTLVLTPAAALAASRASLTEIENDVMCVSCREPLAVAQSPQAYAERAFIRGNKQDWRQAAAGATAESDVSLAQRREYVARELVHEGLLAGGLLSHIN